MAGIVLSIALAFLFAGLLFLLVKGRFKLAEDVQQNEILNFFVYVGIAFALMFPLVFFVVGA